MGKIKCKLFLMMAGIGLTLSAQAQTYNLANAQKVYVSPEDVQLNNSSIYVWNGHEWLPANAIFSDGIGLYYELFQEVEPVIDHWDCPTCESYNFPDWANCHNCGWPW